MICVKPFRKDGSEYGCGQCMPCRFNLRRLWTLRLMLESTQHQASSFVTLTYAPEFYPADGSVSPEHFNLFMKRVVYYCGPTRYYGVGEYGDRTWRAHYHCVLFGTADVALISKAWTQGGVHVGSLTSQSAAYVCGYGVKHMTNKVDPRLGGRTPEFARMSRRPGLGATAMETLAAWICSERGCEWIAKNGDVPHLIRWDGQEWPLGRYLRRVLREKSGFIELGQPEEIGAVLRMQKQLSILDWRDIDKRELERKEVNRRSHFLYKHKRSLRGL